MFVFRKIWRALFSFQQKVESIQYNAAVAITEAIRGTSKEKLLKS